MSTLHPISGCESSSRLADVLFLHGLGGDAITTWRHGDDETTSWPHWLGEEFPQVGVWSLGYAASPSKRLRGPRQLWHKLRGKPWRDVGQTMALPDRARQVLDLMVQRDFGKRPLMLICHSLGGLLAKQILRTASEPGDPRRLAVCDSTRAVLFLATPHAGAELASRLDAFRTILGTTVSIEDLRAHDAHLRDLQASYRSRAKSAGIETVTYFETRDLLGFRIVNETSSDPGVGADPVGLDEDHLSITKPRERDAQVCGAARDLLQNLVIGGSGQGPGGQPEGGDRTAPTEEGALRDSPEVAPSRLRHGAETLFGRAADLRRLDGAWRGTKTKKTNVLSIVAWGGVGKTALVAEWMNRLAGDGWRGADRVFDWSFYSQGTRGDGDSDKTVSADAFIAAALEWFGDPDPQAGSPWDRGARLAALVGKTRSLLVLDGLEPLQHPPGPLAGQLTDPALIALLKGLAAQNAGLCIVTTREHVADLGAAYDKTVGEWELEQLSDEAGAALLHAQGVRRAGEAAVGPDDDELRAASREVDGHALTLTLMGKYLALTLDGDIRRRDVFKFGEADSEWKTNIHDAGKPYGHAFKVIGTYETWFKGEAVREQGEGGTELPGAAVQLAILRLVGLFNRPAQAGCLAALRGEPAIEGLTEPLVGLDEREWKATVTRLEEIGLLKRDGSAGGQSSLDAHPLVREFFGGRLREKQPAAWQAAHERLYEHLTSMTEHQPGTLEGLQPLYQAVAHGCLAGLHQQACNDVYDARILRGTESGGNYSTFKLGAIGADLGAVACFFDTPWTAVSPKLAPADQAWLLNEAAFSLRALGRLTEATEPMRAGLEMLARAEDWKSAAAVASNLSELELTRGAVSAAVTTGGESVMHADRSGDAFQRLGKRARQADALHQAGRTDEARGLFEEAERIQADSQPQYPRLYSQPCFMYCDLLLAPAERAAWRVVFRSANKRGTASFPGAKGDMDAVTKRATQTLVWAEQNRAPLLDIALDHLTLARAALYRGLLDVGESHAGSPPALETQPHASEPAPELATAVDGLRKAGTMHGLPRALLTRAWQRKLCGDDAGSRQDLDEAWEIAERGGMLLFQADIHLTRARLFFRADAYPWHSAQDDLARARDLIHSCGYHRRDEELADAEAAITPPANAGETGS